MTEKNNKETKSPTQKGSDSTALANPSLGFPGIFGGFMKPFEDFMRPSFLSKVSPFWTDLNEREPTMEIQDRGDHFSLTAQIPGFDKKDVEVRVNGNVLELTAEKRSEEKDKKGDGKQSTYSYFHRYMTLPERVLSEKVDGTMKNGVLELKLPKVEPKPKDSSRRVHLN